MFKTRDQYVQQLKNRNADLQSELDAMRRVLRVTEAERDALAGVVARDRERVLAETRQLAARAQTENR